MTKYSLPYPLPLKNPHSPFRNFNYIRPIQIKGSNKDLRDYQVKIVLNRSNFPFEKCRPDGGDIRFRDDTGKSLPYWVQSWGSQEAVIWCKVPFIPARRTKVIWVIYGNPKAETCSDPEEVFDFFDDFGTAADYYKFSVPTSEHNTYGFAYPVTYEFSIPPGSSGLKAYKKYAADDSWVQIEEKTSDDFFNGVEAVRFDYDNNAAYVSVAFDANSDDVYLKIVDSRGQSVGSYVGITKYYDNRKCVVTCTADEWDDCDTSYVCGQVNKFGSGARTTCDECRKRHLWISIAIVTKGRDNGGEPDWSDIQSKIDAGYVEPTSHSRTHADAQDPSFDAESEVDGSKNDIINNLTLPPLNRKGSTEYVYAFLEPFGHSNSEERAQLGASKYLCDRDSTYDDYDFASWDSTNGLYNRIGWAMRMGVDGVTDVSELNSAFDNAYNNGKIYHLFWHTAQETTSGCYGVDYTEGSYFHQHLDYIKDRKDVWYVAFGHLYVYHYLQSRNIITVTSYGGSSGVDTNKWNIVEGDISASGGMLHLEGTTGTRGNMDGKKAIPVGAAIHVRAKYQQLDSEFTHFCKLRKSGDDSYRVDIYVYSEDGVPAALTANAGSVTGAEAFPSVSTPLEWHEYKITWQEGEAKYYQDDDLKITHTTNVPTIDLVPSFQEGTIPGGNIDIDYVFVRKFNSPEPVVEV